MSETLRPVYWVGTAKDDLDAFPEDVKDVMGYALEQAQRGLKHRKAKPLKGFSGASVMEIADDYDADTYRAVYTVRLRSGIYVLHCWQKKSVRGIKTLPQDIERIRARLRTAEEQDARRREAHGPA
jgi:phage-related protein